MPGPGGQTRPRTPIRFERPGRRSSLEQNRAAAQGEVVVFDRDQFLARVRDTRLGYGQPLHYFEETISTNDEALAGARAGAPQGALYLAERQRRGRGRRGRSWFSGPGESLTFSVIVRPRVQLEALHPLTLVVGVALREALAAHTRESLLVKWPNDIVMRKSEPGARERRESVTADPVPALDAADPERQGDRKLAGVLVESTQGTSPGWAHAVIGIGINYRLAQFPAELAEMAMSFHHVSPNLPPREVLLIEILTLLERHLQTFERLGPKAAIEQVRTFDALLGQEIQVDDRSGTGAGIGDGGELLLRQEDRITTIRSGTVIRRR